MKGIVRDIDVNIFSRRRGILAEQTFKQGSLIVYLPKLLEITSDMVQTLRFQTYFKHLLIQFQTSPHSTFNSTPSENKKFSVW